uniref:Putative secreted protein n=1 Tax=Anopheles darlingi TaxID=43151 RepID=A0A2M4DRD5_ANODA
MFARVGMLMWFMLRFWVVALTGSGARSQHRSAIHPPGIPIMNSMCSRCNQPRQLSTFHLIYMLATHSLPPEDRGRKKDEG